MSVTHKNHSLKGILSFIVIALLLSGGIRLGSMSIAYASGTPDNSTDISTEEAEQCITDDATKELMELLQTRDAAISERENEQNERQDILDQAAAEIQANLIKLEEAEAQLSKTIEQVSGASSGDIEQLTAVYQSMKPKDAAQLFEQMTPKFAAGFLAGMPPAAAAGILSGLSTDKAYAVSVVLAGRNATAPKE